MIDVNLLLPLHCKCGSQPGLTFYPETGSWKVECKGCSSAAPVATEAEEAVVAWNDELGVYVMI